MIPNHTRSLLLTLATDPALTDSERADLLRVAEGRIAVDPRPPMTYTAFAAAMDRSRGWVASFFRHRLPSLHVPRHLHPGPCGVPAALVDWLKTEASTGAWKPREYRRRQPRQTSLR